LAIESESLVIDVAIIVYVLEWPSVLELQATLARARNSGMKALLVISIQLSVSVCSCVTPLLSNGRA
jgi:hypothetical protein